MHACDRNRSLGLPVINQEASMTTTTIIIIKISRKKRKRKLNISFKYPNRTHYQKKNKQNPKKTNKNKQNQISNAISQTLIHPNQHPSINPSYKSSSSSKKKNRQNPKKRNVANASISPPSSKSQIRRALSRVRIICIIHRYVIARGNEWASKAGRVTDVCSSE